MRLGFRERRLPDVAGTPRVAQVGRVSSWPRLAGHRRRRSARRVPNIHPDGASPSLQPRHPEPDEQRRYGADRDEIDAVIGLRPVAEGENHDDRARGGQRPDDHRLTTEPVASAPREEAPG